MRVQLNTDRVGPGCTDSAGDVIDVPAGEARRLVAAGQAAIVHADGDVVETNAVEPTERRVARTGKPQPRKPNHVP